MAKSNKITMRILHRYLGFFLAGIMAVYALSGIVMVFRNTDFLKKEVKIEKTIKTGLKPDEIGKEIRMRDFKAEKEEGDVVFFKTGTYNKATGEISYTSKELPFVLNSMTKMHKATTDSPLYYLNIFFGISLLFFVVSTFWMFRPSTTIFKNGLIYTAVGIVLTLIMLFV